MSKLLILPKEIKKHITEFMYPTKEQMEMWYMCHYINYYKVMEEIKDVIIEIKIGRNGNMKCVFSLFSWSILDHDWYSDDDVW